MKSIDVKGTARNEFGKKGAKALRKQNLIPCNLYGVERDAKGLPVAKAFSVTFEEVRKLVYSPDIFSVNLTIDGNTVLAVMREIQFHPVKDNILHIDFYQVDPQKPIVMAVPEGLPLMIAIVSSMNMKKMLNDNVLVRKVSGIETAGSLNILFSDKTGTITKGKLEAVNFLDGTGKEAKSFDEIKGKAGEMLALALKHNTNAVITGSGDTLKVVGGNPTERAVLQFVAHAEDKYPNVKPVYSVPFNSTNKYSATTVEGDKNTNDWQ